jgi:hypothetical protein
MDDSTTTVDEPTLPYPKGVARSKGLRNTVLHLQRVEIVNFGIITSDSAPQSRGEIIDDSADHTALLGDDFPVESELSDSTSLDRTSSEETVYQAVRSLFRSAYKKDLELGEESRFFAQLSSLLDSFGRAGVEMLHDFIVAGKVSEELAWQTLIFVGEVEHQATRPYRLELLSRSLSSKSHWIRDGATLGLAAVDDVAAANSMETTLAELGR